MDNDNDYIKYIYKKKLDELAKLPELNINDILKYDEPYKMVLLFYYGHSHIYKKKYNCEELNKKIHYFIFFNGNYWKY
jgi:hypothetical protein